MAQSFGAYVPKIIGAVAILIIGWIFILIVPAIARRVLRRTGLGNRIANWGHYVFLFNDKNNY